MPDDERHREYRRTLHDVLTGVIPPREAEAMLRRARERLSGHVAPGMNVIIPSVSPGDDQLAIYAQAATVSQDQDQRRQARRNDIEDVISRQRLQMRRAIERRHEMEARAEQERMEAERLRYRAMLTSVSNRPGMRTFPASPVEYVAPGESIPVPFPNPLSHAEVLRRYPRPDRPGRHDAEALRNARPGEVMYIDDRSAALTEDEIDAMVWATARNLRQAGETGSIGGRPRGRGSVWEERPIATRPMFDMLDRQLSQNAMPKVELDFLAAPTQDDFFEMPSDAT